MKKNCWEFKGCDQHQRGRVTGLLKCPVPEMTSSNGINGGENAGRICWLIAHTMCQGEAEATFEEMLKTCGECDFYKLVKEEEGDELALPLEIIRETYEKAKQRLSKNRLGDETVMD